MLETKVKSLCYLFHNKILLREYFKCVTPISRDKFLNNKIKEYFEVSDVLHLNDMNEIKEYFELFIKKLIKGNVNFRQKGKNILKDDNKLDKFSSNAINLIRNEFQISKNIIQNVENFNRDFIHSYATGNLKKQFFKGISFSKPSLNIRKHNSQMNLNQNKLFQMLSINMNEKFITKKNKNNVNLDIAKKSVTFQLNPNFEEKKKKRKSKKISQKNSYDPNIFSSKINWNREYLENQKLTHQANLILKRSKSLQNSLKTSSKSTKKKKKSIHFYMLKKNKLLGDNFIISSIEQNFLLKHIVIFSIAKNNYTNRLKKLNFEYHKNDINIKGKIN